MDFAILALPRSGTTWAANWLTTNGVRCFHDPWERRRPADIQSPDGIACTGSWLFPKVMAALPARTIVLDRPIREVNLSLLNAGLATVTDTQYRTFREETAHLEHFHWTDLFRAPYQLWTRLRDDRLDWPRHSELQRMQITVDLNQYAPDPAILRELL